ncbi:MAG: MerR family transcriptional regulator [Pseudomonadota bacterium]
MSADGELPLVRKPGKSEAAFRTISEVAEELDVPQHVLRFWESKFPQVKPLKRGGGRRYYRPEDVQLLRQIRDLLYSEGYTIKGVQKLLREGGLKAGGNGGGAKPASEPRLDLGREEDEMAFADEDTDGDEPEDNEAPDEGEVAEDAREPVVKPPAGAAFAPEVRRELEGLLAELEQLRGLLQPRER